MKYSRLPKAPKALSAEARRRWRELVAEYDIRDSAGLQILQTAMEAFDRMLVQDVSALRDARFPGAGIADFRGTARARGMTGHAGGVVDLFPVPHLGDLSRCCSGGFARCGFGSRLFACDADPAGRRYPLVN